MISTASRRAGSTARVFRVPCISGGNRLVLEHEGRHFDLSQGSEHSRRVDLLELVERGFFDLLPELGQAAMPLRSPTGAPVEALTPLDPRQIGKILALTGSPRELFERRAAGDGCRWFSNRSPATVVANGTALDLESLSGTDRPDALLELEPGVVRHDAFLAVVISRRACGVEVADAANFIAGYTLASDFTRRTLDGRPRTPWFGESPAGSLILGPAFAPRRSLDLSHLIVRSRRLRGGTFEPELARRCDFTSDVALAVAALSRLAILHPGDLVLIPTGTGQGAVESGDEVSCEIEGVGELTTLVRRRAPLRQHA